MLFFKICWGSSRNWLEPKIEPSLTNLAYLNQWNTLYLFWRKKTQKWPIKKRVVAHFGIYFFLRPVVGKYLVSTYTWIYGTYSNCITRSKIEASLVSHTVVFNLFSTRGTWTESKNSKKCYFCIFKKPTK